MEELIFLAYIQLLTLSLVFYYVVSKMNYIVHGLTPFYVT